MSTRRPTARITNYLDLGNKGPGEKDILGAAAALANGYEVSKLVGARHPVAVSPQWLPVLLRTQSPAAIAAITATATAIAVANAALTTILAAIAAADAALADLADLAALADLVAIAALAAAAGMRCMQRALQPE